jgi:hypothetical protein
MQPNEPTDYNQPVAYDKDGNPLYAHPPTQTQTNDVAPQFVHVSRAVDPIEPEMSREAVKRHEDSVARYPELNLSKEEYIINEVRRHPIGLFGILAAAAVLILIVLGALSFYPTLVPSGNPPLESLILPALLFILLICLIAYIFAWVYLNNKFFLTNESVIQEIQISLFARNEQTVSLSNIEDASYTQTGLIQIIFNYGSIRLSTEGDETTYRFHFVSDPKKQIATLNNAVEAFKNGRPVGD